MEWISVKERLPKVDGRYIAWVKFRKGNNGNYPDATWTVDFHGRWHLYIIDETFEVTHWQPLPKEPNFKKVNI